MGEGTWAAVKMFLLALVFAPVVADIALRILGGAEADRGGPSGVAEGRGDGRLRPPPNPARSSLMFASTKTAHGEVAFEGSGGPPDFTAHDVEYLARDGSAHRIDQPGGRAWAFTHEAPPGAILGKLVAKRS